jgi:glycosyltransferase involved in cell wall biosynthesis
MKTTLFIPVKNEIESIPVIMPRIKQEWVDEILVVDGNSTDGTYEWFRDNGYNVIRQKSAGLGSAYWECLEIAIGDIIIAFSPDNNSIPELIPPLIAKMREGYEMVIVSRYLDGAKSEDDDLVTAFGNWLFAKIVNLLFRANYTDTLVMYRAFTKQLVKELNIERSHQPIFEMQLVVRSAKLHRKVTEIPGDEPKRFAGIRKMRPLYNGSVVLLCILREFFKRG